MIFIMPLSNTLDLCLNQCRERGWMTEVELATLTHGVFSSSSGVVFIIYQQKHLRGCRVILTKSHGYGAFLYCNKRAHFVEGRALDCW